MLKSIHYSAGCLALICSGWAQAPLADTAPRMLNGQCESRAPEFGDTRDVTCSFPASEAEQHFVFKVNFVGSHDDTMLSMTPVLNAQPLTCDAGSKTSSRFEDGEISLECRFSVKAKAKPAQVLQVAIVWTHAQYAEFEFSVQ